MENDTRPPEANEPAIPPYEDRADSGSKAAEEEGRAGTPAGSSGAPDNAEQTTSPSDEQPASEQTQTRETDTGVGPAHQAGTSRGEDVGDSSEAGRHDTGDKGDSDRPTGESSGRDTTSVDAQEDD